MKLANQFAIGFIQIYQRIWHPIYIGIADRTGGLKICRFDPSCSEYAIIAFRKYSFTEAFKKTLLRLKRCDGVRGGYDPP